MWQIKGDSPEKVEFIGMQNLINAVKNSVGLKDGKLLFGSKGIQSKLQRFPIFRFMNFYYKSWLGDIKILYLDALQLTYLMCFKILGLICPCCTDL